MNRKSFLSSVLPAAAAFSAESKNDALPTPANPPYLKRGDTVGITSPAGYITLAEIEPAINKLKDWGFACRIGNTIGKRSFTFGGTDAERLQDFQQMLDDKNVKAILCARGGYGTVRIVDQLDFKKFKNYPKWIIGFSDVTVMHSHINRNVNLASIHAKMCNSFPANWDTTEPIQLATIESIRNCLTGMQMSYPFLSNTNNRTGKAEGILVGGNLKTLESLAGSKSDLDTNNKILFVEDTGEYLYSIDRMFWNLKRSGKLEGLAGLIVGGFKLKKDDEGEGFGKSLEEIVLEKTVAYNFPVCFDFPVGHQKNNFALKCGIKHQLLVNANQCLLTESI